MTPEEISLITLISSILLTIITAIYVIFTYFLLRQTREMNETQRDLITLPYLKCNLSNDKNKKGRFIFSITNYGNQPAFDVDAFIIAVYDEDDCEIEEFKKILLAERCDFTPTDEGAYGVYDRLLYAHFPAKTQALDQIDFPMTPLYFEVYVQYRNLLKTNFSFLFSFSDVGKTELSLEKSEIYERDITRSTPRLELEFIDPKDFTSSEEYQAHPFNLVSESNEEIPKFLEGFISLFSHSVSRGEIKNYKFTYCEGRGTFKNID